MTATAITTDILFCVITGNNVNADDVEDLAIWADPRHPGVGSTTPSPEDDWESWQAETESIILAALLPGSTVTDVKPAPGQNMAFTVQVPVA